MGYYSSCALKKALELKELSRRKSTGVISGHIAPTRALR